MLAATQPSSLLTKSFKVSPRRRLTSMLLPVCESQINDEQKELSVSDITSYSRSLLLIVWDYVVFFIKTNRKNVNKQLKNVNKQLKNVCLLSKKDFYVYFLLFSPKLSACEINLCDRLMDGILKLLHRKRYEHREGRVYFCEVGSLFTVWKFQYFSITQILREITVSDFRGTKTAILTNSEAVVFYLYEILHFLRAGIFQMTI